MAQQQSARMTIDAEIRVPLATAQLVRFDVYGPIAGVLNSMDDYRVDLALTPRPSNARACYNSRWSPHRFERLGKVYIVPPHETVQACSDGSSSQMSILCHIKPEAMPAEMQWTDRRLEASLDVRDSNVRGLLLRLAHEMRHPGFASEMLVELIVAQLGIDLARYCTRVHDVPVSGGLSPWRLRLIDERLREVQAAPTLNELAGLCKLSVRQLTRGFSASRGCSIGSYVANARIDHAKRMLLCDESVKAISYSLGFSSPSGFCYAFRRATGVTPREFRQRVPRAPAVAVCA
ncbi:MAG: AraC family transcriptional regulator [Hydrocarboniphaga sp.]|uniref:AraC family transcriptional regulator n=1 Tax=Hydrocarboniphaga sp. TaxID=2033016 RepID=UPI0026187A51|nr:AraC family transcriptional regulator [Hydrocarboniphaga sp.]MDB5968662.1 AraC family transcriptional regulator [Hydrocarboniphaga sp.]